MKKLLIGGSPCTHWSIVKTKNRETKPEGVGWELFKNYLIAKEKFQPDFFLYENNKSAAQPIKDQISRELGVPLQYINSALVSAQNRQRFYAHNIPNVPQPEDRGILLKDILESGTAWKEKAYTLDANYYKTSGVGFGTQAGRRKMAAEFLCPVGIAYRGRKGIDGKYYKRYESHGEQKANALTTVQTDSMVAISSNAENELGVCLGGLNLPHGFNKGGIKYDKAPTLTANGSWQHNNYVIVKDERVNAPVYTVKNGTLTYRDISFPINLPDGDYIIRKLTPTECERLQTLPDGYTEGVSNTQRYKCLGNGWTAEVIIHILRHMQIPRDEELIVLSMYDGIATGRYCLDVLGYTNVHYYATETDKYAVTVALKNYPDIVELGDAFQVREKGWAMN